MGRALIFAAVMGLVFLLSAPVQAEVRTVWISTGKTWEKIEFPKDEPQKVDLFATYLVEIGDKPPAAFVFAVRDGNARMRILWENDNEKGKFTQVYNKVVTGGNSNRPLALNTFTFSVTTNKKVRVELSIEEGHGAVGLFTISY